MRALIAISIVLAWLPACNRRDDLDGRRRPIPGLDDPSGGVATPVVGEKRLAFDFIDNRAAALVYVDGALTASGRGIAFSLLSRGGPATQWKLGSGASPSARTDGQVANVIFPFDRDPGGIRTGGATIPIAMRFRPAARGQLVSAFLNETKVGDVPMTEVGTAEYRLDVPTPLLVRGENNLKLFFRYAVADQGLRTAGALERISIGSGSAPTTAPVRAAPVERDGKRRDALTASGPARLSFYLRVPRSRPVLRLHVAGAGTASVRVTRGAAPSRELWRQGATASWSAATIDVGEYAGELVRVDFVGDAALDWGRMQMLADVTDVASSASTAASPHVVVWIIGGLRADSVAKDGPMPALRELAERGTVHAASARTPAAAVAAGEILAGRSMSRSTQITSADQMLGERFREAGYKTTLYSNAPAIAGDSQGFDRIVRSQTLDAAALWKRAQADLKGNASVRTLSVLWVSEPVLPWTPEATQLDPQWRSYAGRVQASATKALSAQLAAGAAPLTDRDRDYVRALYRGELATVDGAIATMVADVDSLGLRDATAIVVVGDRGQELFEPKGFGEPRGLGPAGRRVPLIAVAPGRNTRPSQGEPRLVLTADAYATALDLGQISRPAASDGESVFAPPVAGRAAVLHLATRARGLATEFATLVEPVRGPTELYSIVSGEEKPLSIDADPTTARALINWLSIVTATQTWDSRRWGQVTSLRAAFSAEHGGL